jgi:hypothetical protein
MFSYDEGTAAGKFKPGEIVFSISLPFDLGEMMSADQHAHEDSWWK